MKRVALKFGFVPINDGYIRKGYTINHQGVIKDNKGSTVGKAVLPHLPAPVAVLRTIDGRNAFDIRYLLSIAFDWPGDWREYPVIHG